MHLDETISYTSAESHDAFVRLQLTRDGKAIFDPVPGQFLERAMHFEDLLILITSHIGFDGNEVYVLVLDEHGKLVDCATLDDAPSSKQGELRDFSVDGHDRFTFAFFTGDRVEFKVNPKSHWRLPNPFRRFVTYSQGFGFRGHLSARRIKNS